MLRCVSHKSHIGDGCKKELYTRKERATYRSIQWSTRAPSLEAPHDVPARARSPPRLCSSTTAAASTPPCRPRTPPRSRSFASARALAATASSGARRATASTSTRSSSGRAAAAATFASHALKTAADRALTSHETPAPALRLLLKRKRDTAAPKRPAANAVAHRR